MKQYIKPQTEVMKVNAMSELLLGSPEPTVKLLPVVNVNSNIIAD